jgi:hypothetical protein
VPRSSKRTRKKVEPDWATALLDDSTLQQLLSKPPPVHNDAEQSLLGCIINYCPASWPIATSMLVEGDFYHLQHKLIWRAIGYLRQEQTPVDLVSVRAKLQEWNALEQAGGYSYLMDLSSNAAMPEQSRYFADVVRRFSVMRNQLERCAAFLNKCDDEHAMALMEALEAGLTQGIEWKNADDLIAEEEQEVEWLVHSLIPANAVTLLAGDPGAGKSFLCLSLCHAYVNGTLWLGRFKVKGRGAALYIDADADPPIQRQRLIALDQGAGIAPVTEEADHRQLYFAFDPPVQVGMRIGALEAHIRQHKAKLVILDNLIELCPDNLDIQKSSGDMRRAIRPIVRLARRLGITIILIHQLKQIQANMPNDPGSRVFGSVQGRAGADAVWTVAKRPDEARIMHAPKIRAAATWQSDFLWKFEAGPDGSGTNLVYSGEVEAEEKLTMSHAVDVILAFLEGQPKPREEIESLLEEEGLRSRAIAVMLSRLVKDGRIESRRDREDGRRSWYTLAGAGWGDAPVKR